MILKTIGILLLSLQLSSTTLAANRCLNFPKNTPSIGINLQGSADSNSVAIGQHYCDVFKTARPFIQTKNKHGQKLKEPILLKEPKKWPCIAPREAVRTTILQSALRKSVPGDTIPVYIQSQLELTVPSNNAKLIDCPQKGKQIAGHIRKCLKLLKKDTHKIPYGINLNFTNKTNRRACLKSIKVVLPVEDCEQKILKNPNGIHFNPRLLRYLEFAKSVRMMNFMCASPRIPDECVRIPEKIRKGSFWEINPNFNNCVANPRDQRTIHNRASLKDATWGIIHSNTKKKCTGAPFEVALELARQGQFDPWFVIPHNASGDYIYKIGQHIKKFLASNPNRKVYVEYGNELWNGRFWGNKYIQSQLKYTNAAKQKTKDKLKELLIAKTSKERERDQLKENENRTSAGIQRQLRAVKSNLTAMARKKGTKNQNHFNKLRQVQQTLTDNLKGTTNVSQKKLNLVKQKINIYNQQIKQTEAQQRLQDHEPFTIAVNKSLQTFKILEQSIGNEHKHSLIKVLGTNQTNKEQTRSMLSYAKKHNSLHKIDSISMGTYFHGCWKKGHEREEGPECKSYFDQGGKGIYDISQPGEALAILQNKNNPKSQPAVAKHVQEHNKIIKSFSKDITLSSYESGHHLTTDNMPKALKPKVLTKAEKKDPRKVRHNNNLKARRKKLDQLLKAASDSPGMGHIYQKSYVDWKNNGGDLNLAFTSAQTDSQHGTWGLSEHYGETNTPKYMATKRYADIFCPPGRSRPSKKRSSPTLNEANFNQ